MTAPERLAQLLAAVSQGDQHAFARLYESCSPHLFGLLLRILRRRDWAEEALQDCFLKIWQKSASYEPSRGTPLTWLSTVARYRALDLLRMKRPEVGMPEEGQELPMTMVDPGQSPLDSAIEGQGTDDLRRCMLNLREEQRRSVLLAYYAGYSHQELAQVMNAPLGTVKSWVRQGLARMHDCLERDLSNSV